jgi:hypothetical protein
MRVSVLPDTQDLARAPQAQAGPWFRLRLFADTFMKGELSSVLSVLADAKNLPCARHRRLAGSLILFSELQRLVFSSLGRQENMKRPRLAIMGSALFLRS